MGLGNNIFTEIGKKKYLITGAVFFFWIAVVDPSSCLQQKKLKEQLNKLETEKIFYQKKIKEDSLKLYELKTNKANLEKFARENYLMKKPNEDIFIIVPEKKKKKKQTEK